jgi:hypothetical protein
VKSEAVNELALVAKLSIKYLKIIGSSREKVWLMVARIRARARYFL